MERPQPDARPGGTQVTDDPARRRAVARVLLLPLVFLTVALLGGMRVAVDRSFVFLPPPLVTLVMAALLASLFMRGRLVRIDTWLGSRHGVLTNVSHALTLLALFFASAQAFNSVLPEQGLLHWMFAFFFLWTLWNDQFSTFDPFRLLRSLGVLFGTGRELGGAARRRDLPGAVARHPRHPRGSAGHGLYLVPHARPVRDRPRPRRADTGRAGRRASAAARGEAALAG